MPVEGVFVVVEKRQIACRPVDGDDRGEAGEDAAEDADESDEGRDTGDDETEAAEATEATEAPSPARTLTSDASISVFQRRATNAAKTRCLASS